MKYFKVKLSFFILIVSLLSSSFISQNTLCNLKVTVRNELGNIEEGAAVQLFLSDEDYRNETNPASAVLLTNKKGQVTFKKLKPEAYFIHVEKGDKNNYGAGIRTDTLAPGRINKVTIIIE